MQPLTPSNLQHQARVYFLAQGQSIGRLYDILNTNALAHHFRKWIGVVAEILLYSLFVLMILFMVLLPSVIEIPISEEPEVNLQVNAEFITGLIILGRAILFVLSLPILLLAISLGRNRRRNTIIRKAFGEVEKMRGSFDQAVKELQL